MRLFQPFPCLFAFLIPCVVAVPVPSNTTVATRRIQGGEGAIKFPDEPDCYRSPTGSNPKSKNPSYMNNNKDSKKINFVPKLRVLPKPEEGGTFLEAADDYPSDYLNSILQNNALEYRNIFGKDILTQEEVEKEIHTRIDSEENEFCKSEVKLVFPKTAKNKDNKWLFVVNDGQFTQGVRIETCINGNKSENDSGCSSYTSSLSPTFTTHCKQKYILRKLLALNSKGEPITDTFQLPSCCSCVVKSNTRK